MKLYFTKYLPVEGDPKEGDMVIYKVIGWTENYEDAVKAATYGDPLPIKVKLFLCSRDIQIGDFATERLTTGEYEDFEIHTENDIFPDMIEKGTQFKKIGEISPEAAKFVREGQEFDEEELYYLLDGRSVRLPIKKLQHEKPEWKMSEKVTIYVKGEDGHFH